MTEMKFKDHTITNTSAKKESPYDWDGSMVIDVKEIKTSPVSLLKNKKLKRLVVIAIMSYELVYSINEVKVF
jgi:hypothetical protein